MLGRGCGGSVDGTGGGALEGAAEVKPQRVILDLRLPGLSGFEVCRRLREWSSVPILVLSVRGDEADKISALDFGADDYLTKTFLAGELLARVRALLRRAGDPESVTSSMVQSGHLSIDLIERRVMMDGRALKLTRTEFAILAALAANADRVVTTRSLLKSVWGAAADDEDQVHALRVHLSHIRSKLETDIGSPRYIVTEPGVGYRLASLPTER